MKRILRQPSLHFIVLGGLLFAVRLFVLPVAEEIEPIVVSEAQVAQMRTDWQRRHAAAPTEEEEQALVDAMVTEEVLFREALRRGLDRDDLVVFRRLVENMRLLTDAPDRSAEDLYREAREIGLDRGDPIVRRRLVHLMKLTAEGGAVRPDEAEIQEYYARHRDRFLEPARVRFSHVFLSRQTHGEGLEDAARRLLTELQATAVSPEDAPARGQAFLLGHHMTRGLGELERGFGGSFAEQVSGLEPGTWGIAESSYGLHVVWVHEHRAAAVAELDAVRRRVLQGIAAERRRQRFESTVARLRQRFPVVVERPAAERMPREGLMR